MVRKAAANTGSDVPRVVKPEEVPAYSWAFNVHKLRNATDYIKLNQSALTGKDLEMAIKARYIEIKGGIVGEEATKVRPKKGEVVNLADDDGSEEIANDDE